LLPIEGGDGSTLNLDFTKGILDSRLNFSRLGTATFVNSQGYVEYAGANLFLQSENISIAPWDDQTGATRTQVAVTNPIGGPTSTRVTTGGGSNAIFQNIVYQAGLPHVLRIWVRAGTSSQIQIGMYTSSFVSGSIAIISGPGTATGTGFFFVNGLTAAWTQLEIKYTVLPAGAVFLLYPDTASPAPNKDIYVWGPQLNPGSTAQTYYPTTTLAYHAPRFDYDPTNIGELKGLLIEGQATNVCPQSQALTTGWLSANMNTPTNPAIADPFGGTSATWKLVAPISTSALRGWRHAVVTLTAANYTFSFWAKAAEFDRIVLADPGSGRGGCAFVLVGEGTATVIPGSTTPTNPMIQSFPGGWYRCSVTMLMLATTYAMGIAGYPSTTTPNEYGATYVQTSLNGVYATGMQIELGSGASSYIPTGTSGVLRTGDSCVMTGTNFSSWFAGATEGVLFAEYEKQRSQSGNVAHDFAAVGSRYNTGEGLILYNANANAYPTSILWTTNGAIFAGGIATPIPLVTRQAARWFGANDITQYSNGIAGTTAAGTGTVTPAMLCFGANSNTGTEASRDWLNSCIRKVKFYPTALPDAAIKALTAPDYVAPTLDLNFLNMSSNTDLINSGLTFGRLSNATFLNSSGYVDYAGTNLLLYSAYADTNWVNYGGYTKVTPVLVTSPIGDTTASRITFDAVGKGLFYNSASLGSPNVTGATYTMSAWIRSTSGTSNIRFGDSAVGLSLNIPITNTWTRYSYTYNNALSNSSPVIQSASGTPTGEFEMWGFQLNPGSTAQTYYPTTTAAYYAPRFDNTILTSRTNLILQSNNFTIAAGTPWQQKDGTHSVTLIADAAPSGFSGTATKITALNTAAGITQALSVPVVSGKLIRLSFYAKSNAATAQSCFLQYNSSTSAVITIPTTWTRIDEIAGSAVTEITLKGFMDPLDISIYGMQVEYVTSGGATAYIPTTTTQGVANTTAPRGLLIEGSAINYMAYSIALHPHSISGMQAIATAAIIDPEGTTNKARIVAADASTSYHARYLSTTAGTNTTITISIFAKRNGYKYLYLSDLANGRSAVRFDLDNGTTSNSAGVGFVSATATPYANGWWRCSMVANITASTLYAWAYVGVPTTGAAFDGYGVQYPGTNIDTDGIYCYGFQVEGGSGASSYIPTGSSTATRTGDSCVMNNITALKYSTQKGSIYWRGIISKQPTAYTTLIGFQTAIDQPTLETFGNALSYFTAARGPGLTGGGGNEVSRAFTLNSTIRYASSVNTLVNPIVSVNLNGSAGSTDKAGNGNMHAATRFVIGRQPLTTTYEASYPSVTLEQIQYYPTALLAHQLQALVS
jgi:hypothetical protein